MKKMVALIMAFVLLLSLSSCSKTQQGDALNNSIPDTVIQEVTDTEEKISFESATEPQEKPFNCEMLITYAKDWAKKKDLSFEFVSDIESKPGETANQKVTEFIFYGGFASASVAEQNDFIQTITTVSVTSKISEAFPLNSSIENSQYAYVICIELLKLCELDKGLDWHEAKLKSAPEEGDETMVIRSYTSNDWFYTAMIGEYFVTCIAARYCSQCNTNAPKVTFSSNTGACDSCNNGQSGGSTSNSGNISNGGNTSNNGNTSNSGSTSYGDNTSNGGNTSQQPASCSHNYANATCTAPKTCTLCGQTSGSALDHTYSEATCTAPKTCNSCGATTGGAAGHKWKSATCTEPQRCTVCNETGEKAHGHLMLFTKCQRPSCDYINFSCIAGAYANIGGYGVPVGTTTMVDLDITNVSVSNSGELSFTYNGKNYTLTLKQNNKGNNFTAFFDCYLNGVLVENVDFRAGNEMYNNRIHLDGFIVDGCKIYLNATQ